MSCCSTWAKRIREGRIKRLREERARLDAELYRLLAVGWKPTGMDGSCDPSCSFCGYQCSHCGSPV